MKNQFLFNSGWVNENGLTYCWEMKRYLNWSHHYRIVMPRTRYPLWIGERALRDLKRQKEIKNNEKNYNTN